MSILHPSIAHLPMPDRIKRLRLDHRGFPVPRFVAWVDGQADHRVVDGRQFAPALKEHRCWICGEPLGKYLAFLLGPMCIISRTISEPPSHRECAAYAAQACPFLTRPYAERREAGKPDDAKAAAGMPITRNPGVVCLWMTRTFTPFLAPMGNGGVLFRVGDPVETAWYCEGRAATRAEVMASLESGLPLLRTEAQKDGAEGEVALALTLQRALQFLPQEVTTCA